MPKLMGGVGALEGMMAGMGVPLAGVAAWVVTLLEVGGGLALVAGFLVTAFSVLLSVHMLMGIFLVHLSNGWYVLGPGTGGAEFNVLIIAGLVALVLAGPGAAALDSRKAGETV